MWLESQDWHEVHWHQRMHVWNSTTSSVGKCVLAFSSVKSIIIVTIPQNKMCITSSSPCFNALLCEAAILLGHHQSTPKAINKRTSPFALLRHSVLVVSHRHLSTQATCRATMQPGWEDHSACWVPGGCWEHDAASVCSCYGGEVVPRVASHNEVGQTGDALHNSWFSMNVCCALIKLTRDSVCWSSGTLYFVTCRKTGIQDDRVPVLK